MTLSIRNAAVQDAQQICDIYNPYVRDTVITFEQQPLAATEMGARIADYSACYPWLVAERDGRLLGYAYATRWRARPAYERTVESTIYIDGSAHRSGIGHPLYAALLDALRRQGIHAAVGCIALPNAGSVALHEKCGFEKVGHFPQVGRKFDQWIDVGFWQVLL